MRLPRRRLLAAALVLAPAAWAGGQASSPVAVQQESSTATLEAAPKPTGYESDLYCFGYLGGTTEDFVAQVASAQDVAEQIDFVSNDLLYIDAGADRGLKPGEEYWLVTPEIEVINPGDGAEPRPLLPVPGARRDPLQLRPLRNPSRQRLLHGHPDGGLPQEIRADPDPSGAPGTAGHGL